MYKLPSARRKKKEKSKLNLIPILDAIFILIFFLLMSAKFIKYREVPSDIPTIKLATPEQEKKDKEKKKLNLTITILMEKIIIQSDDFKIKNTITYKKEDIENKLLKFKEALIDLKEQHPKEDSLTFKTADKIKYKTLILILDEIKNYKVNNKRLTLFPNISFEKLKKEDKS